MEELTKQQIVLVTLLVSFVTSIATGIVTVALMDQAPPGVTQTINRVVERTIEKIVPAPNTNQSAAVVTKETVVVKEDDLVVEAVEQNTKSLVAIFSFPSGGDGKTGKFLANGLIVSKEGLIATDSSILTPIIDENNSLILQTFKAVLSDGTSIAIIPTSSAASSDSISIFKPDTDITVKLPIFTPASIADATSLKLGQTIIALGGEKISVATGIVSNLSGSATTDTLGSATSTTSTPSEVKPKIIKTDILSSGKTLGNIIVNLSGDVVGIRTASSGNTDNLYMPASLISQALSKSAVSKAIK